MQISREPSVYALVSLKQKRLRVYIGRRDVYAAQVDLEADGMQKLCNCGNATQSQCRLDSAMNTLLRRTARVCVYIITETVYRRRRVWMKSAYDERVLPHVVVVVAVVLSSVALYRAFWKRGNDQVTRRSDNSKSDSRIYSMTNATTAWKTSRVCSFHARIMCSRGLMGGSFAICITSRRSTDCESNIMGKTNSTRFFSDRSSHSFSLMGNYLIFLIVYCIRANKCDVTN